MWLGPDTVGPGDVLEPIQQEGERLLCIYIFHILSYRRACHSRERASERGHMALGGEKCIAAA